MLSNAKDDGEHDEKLVGSESLSRMIVSKGSTFCGSELSSCAKTLEV